MSREEYGSAPFVAGVLTGVRIMNYFSGDLRAPLYNSLWTADVNQALCFCGGFPCFCSDCRPYIGFDFVHQKTRMPEHGEDQVGSLEAKCGFYACHTVDDLPDYLAGPLRLRCSVVAIIDGWGRVTTGSKGFRCSKARIKAIVRMPEPSTPADLVQPYQERSNSRFATMSQLYPSIPIFPTIEEAIEEYPLSKDVA